MFFVCIVPLGWGDVFSQLGSGGLDVCSFVQLTPIHDMAAFFVSFNYLTEHFFVIGSTRTRTRMLNVLFELICANHKYPALDEELLLVL